jgi:hypothetical protein
MLRLWSAYGFAYLAAATTTIKFGTGVYILPLRNPFAVAKAVAIGSENDIERIINYRRCVVNIGADKTGGNFKLVAEWSRELDSLVGEVEARDCRPLVQRQLIHSTASPL